MAFLNKMIITRKLPGRNLWVLLSQLEEAKTFRGISAHGVLSWLHSRRCDEPTTLEHDQLKCTILREEFMSSLWCDRRDERDCDINRYEICPKKESRKLQGMRKNPGIAELNGRICPQKALILLWSMYPYCCPHYPSKQNCTALLLEEFPTTESTWSSCPWVVRYRRRCFVSMLSWNPAVLSHRSRPFYFQLLERLGIHPFRSLSYP